MVAVPVRNLPVGRKANGESNIRKQILTIYYAPLSQYKPCQRVATLRRLRSAQTLLCTPPLRSTASFATAFVEYRIKDGSRHIHSRSCFGYICTEARTSRTKPEKRENKAARRPCSVRSCFPLESLFSLQYQSIVVSVWRSVPVPWEWVRQLPIDISIKTCPKVCKTRLNARLHCLVDLVIGRRIPLEHT